MEETDLLKKIGLTNSESKVYLALIKIGRFTSKKDILKESKIAPSKIYHVLEKLMNKGLVSTINKNNVKHFAAATPKRVKDYIKIKKEEIRREEETAKKLLPKLEGLYKTFGEKTTAEIFMGWKGLDTVYLTMIDKADKKGEVYVLGASEGVNPEKTKNFFSKYSLKAKSKELKMKIIYNENSRDYAKEIEKIVGIKFNKKFLFKTTPVEITITKDFTMIVMLKEEPLAILIKDKETAESFVTYFKELWKIAKN